MAKTTITRTCGHTETVNISGPYKGRERQEQYEASKLCRECYIAQQQAQREAANAAAAVASQEQGLPNLQGSEKQVAWAGTIRQDRLQPAAALRQHIEANATGDERTNLLAALTAVEAETSAAWWIEHRDAHITSMVRERMA